MRLRFDAPGLAFAQVRRRRGGATTALPGVGVTMMDRPLDLATVDRLAGQIRRQIQ